MGNHGTFKAYIGYPVLPQSTINNGQKINDNFPGAAVKTCGPISLIVNSSTCLALTSRDK
jgi:hypothetical protein